MLLLSGRLKDGQRGPLLDLKEHWNYSISVYIQ